MVDLLLAPAAPLLASLPQSSTPTAGAVQNSTTNKYDFVLDVLRGALESPGIKGDEKYSPVRAFLDMAPARPGVARYDFVRNLIRGLATTESQDAAPYDMLHDLIEVRDLRCITQDINHMKSDLLQPSCSLGLAPLLAMTKP